MKIHRPVRTRRPLPAGFTLIELLVVIAIIGILAALTMGTFTFAQQSAARNRTTGSLSAIVNGLEQYKEKFGEYPEAADTSATGSGSSTGLRVGGALMLYQAITGDGDDKIMYEKNAGSKSPGTRSSDGKIDDTERDNSIRGDLPKTMVLSTSNGYMLIDGFGHPFQYEKGGSPGAVNSSFDVWSFAQLNTGTAAASYSGAVKKDEKATKVWIKNW